ncbi:hypothetical protein [Sphingosinicella sp.]|uniref:hypothetical protein n=1 Tax=Sphingosinicella sp. TaxID=1917971 RepID=UPI0040379AF3
MRTVEIDFDVHRMIENERRGFDEPPNTALRRLLNLPEAIAAPELTATTNSQRPWREGLVEIPHGAKARMKYQRGRQIFEGMFLDGHLVVDGREYSTLSSAASALARTRDGSVPSLNGWLYWEAMLPGENHWRRLRDLRDEAMRRSRA